MAVWSNQDLRNHPSLNIYDVNFKILIIINPITNTFSDVDRVLQQPYTKFLLIYNLPQYIFHVLAYRADILPKNVYSTDFALAMYILLPDEWHQVFPSIKPEWLFIAHIKP